jgi:hypothetical protein
LWEKSLWNCFGKIMLMLSVGISLEIQVINLIIEIGLSLFIDGVVQLADVAVVSSLGTEVEGGTVRVGQA